MLKWKLSIYCNGRGKVQRRLPNCVVNEKSEAYFYRKKVLKINSAAIKCNSEKRTSQEGWLAPAVASAGASRPS